MPEGGYESIIAIKEACLSNRALFDETLAGLDQCKQFQRLWLALGLMHSQARRGRLRLSDSPSNADYRSLFAAGLELICDAAAARESFAGLGIE
jgi:hypothetical protein